MRTEWTYRESDPEASGDIGCWEAKRDDRWALIFPAMVPELAMPDGVELDMESADLAVEVEPALYHWSVGVTGDQHCYMSGAALDERSAKRNAGIVFERWTDEQIVRLTAAPR